MSNVIQYLVTLSEEQKAMFNSMSERVDSMDDHVSVILMKIREIQDKIDRLE